MAALRRDICVALADELAAEAADLPDDGLLQLFALCRAFRRWALANAHEFTLVFASPQDGGARRFEEPFGQVFLASAGRLLATHDLALPPTDTIPEALRADLVGYQDDLLGMLAAAGQKFPAEKLDLGLTYMMMTLWARLYGHVTLEVFGNYPMRVRDPDALFETVLADLAGSIGISGP